MVCALHYRMRTGHAKQALAEQQAGSEPRCGSRCGMRWMDEKKLDEPRITKSSDPPTGRRWGLHFTYRTQRLEAVLASCTRCVYAFFACRKLGLGITRLSTRMGPPGPYGKSFLDSLSFCACVPVPADTATSR